MKRSEVLFCLIVKIVLLYIIWKVCFAHPVDKTLVASEVGQHILTPMNRNTEEVL